MRRIVGVAACLALLGVASSAAAADRIPCMSLYVGGYGGGHLVLNDWEFVDPVESENRPKSSFVGGLRLGTQLAWWLALEGDLGWLPMKSEDGGSNTTLHYSGGALFHFLKKGAWLPYAEFGMGLYHNTSGDLGGDKDRSYHWGVGVRHMLNDWIAARAQLRHLLSDGEGDKTFPNAHNLELSVGVDLFVLAEPPDTDEDGIIDAKDECPNEPGVASGRGCPDKDGDGTADKADRCPDVAGVATLSGCADKDKDGVADLDDKCMDVPGVAALGGCPDKDGDGVTDASDACPDQAGSAALRGCPDADNDGIADGSDRCPAKAGLATLGGCPDSDGDGIADPDDRCPTTAGLGHLNGCPDRDHDGITDAEDRCPDVAGAAKLQGCLPEEVTKKFTGSIKGIRFALGSAKIQPASFKLLDEAAALFVEYPSLRLGVDGHTDNQGDVDYNIKLSQERAEAVRTYLIGKGVDGSRIEAKGFGPNQPKADNSTPAGRAENRRIEFRMLGH